MAGPLANIATGVANGVSKYFGGGKTKKDADGDLSMLPPPSAAIAAANGYGNVTHGNALAAAAAAQAASAGSRIYTQFKNAVLDLSRVANLKDISSENFERMKGCYTNAEFPATSNWLALLYGFAIHDSSVCVIHPEGAFYRSVAANRSEWYGKNGYMMVFKNYVKATLPTEYAHLVACRQSRKWFWRVKGQYTTMLPNIHVTETVGMTIENEEDAPNLEMEPDHKHTEAAAAAAAAAASGALAARSDSAKAQAAAKSAQRVADVKARLLGQVAKGESVHQIVRASNDSKTRSVDLGTIQYDQLVNAMALAEIGKDTAKAAAAKGDKDAAKDGRLMARAGAAQIRAAAANFAGAMTYVDAKTAVAKYVGDIDVVDTKSPAQNSYPVYVIADQDGHDWFVMKLEAFEKMCLIGRDKAPTITEKHRVKIERPDAAPVYMVPLIAKTFVQAAGNTGESSRDLAVSYECQLDIIKKRYWSSGLAPSGPAAVMPRNAI